MEASEKKQPTHAFGSRLRREREKRHLSQEKLAEMVGCDARSIRRWEQGKSLPDYENRHNLSLALDMEMEAFNQLLLPAEENEPILHSILDNKPATIIDSITQHSDHAYLSRADQPIPQSVPDTQPPTPSNGTEASLERANYLLRRRRTLLKWGAVGFTALAAGEGAFYWFTRPTSRPTSPLLYTYTAQSGVAIYDAEWSPAGNYLACVNAHNVAQIITDFSGTFHPSLQKPAVNCLTWSPNGAQLTSPASDGTLRVWDPVNGIDAFSFQDYTITPEGIAWSHDGKSIALSGKDGIVHILSAVTGKALLTYRAHIGTVWWVAWSPDDKLVASAGADATVRIWNATSGQTLLIYKGHSKAVVDVKWSRTGRRIVSASEDATARIWDTSTGQTKLIYRGHTASVQAAEWSPDERSIASSSADTTIQQWDALTGKHLATYTGHSNTVWTLSWSPNGKCLASTSQDGTLRIWQIRDPF